MNENINTGEDTVFMNNINLPEKYGIFKGKIL